MAKIPSRKFSNTKKKIPSRKFPKSQRKISSRKLATGTAKIVSRKFSKNQEAANKKPDAPVRLQRLADEKALQDQLAILKGELKALRLASDL